MLFLPVFKFFDDYLGGVRVTIESQSGWRLNVDIKMSHPVSLGQLRIIISPFWTCITAKKCQNRFYSKTVETEGSTNGQHGRDEYILIQ